jgi:hypothetical protein
LHKAQRLNKTECTQNRICCTSSLVWCPTTSSRDAAKFQEVANLKHLPNHRLHFHLSHLRPLQQSYIYIPARSGSSFFPLDLDRELHVVARSVSDIRPTIISETHNAQLSRDALSHDLAWPCQLSYCSLSNSHLRPPDCQVSVSTTYNSLHTQSSSLLSSSTQLSSSFRLLLTGYHGPNVSSSVKHRQVVAVAATADLESSNHQIFGRVSRLFDTNLIRQVLPIAPAYHACHNESSVPSISEMAPAPVINTFSEDEERYIIYLKEEVGGLSWIDLASRYNAHFCDRIQRSQGSLQVRCITHTLRERDFVLSFSSSPSNAKSDLTQVHYSRKLRKGGAKRLQLDKAKRLTSTSALTTTSKPQACSAQDLPHADNLLISLPSSPPPTTLLPLPHTANLSLSRCVSKLHHTKLLADHVALRHWRHQSHTTTTRVFYRQHQWRAPCLCLLLHLSMVMGSRKKSTRREKKMTSR